MLKLSRSISKLCILLIETVRPLLGPPCCRFAVGCTEYGIDALKKGPLLRALWLIIVRLCYCTFVFWKP